MQVYLTGATGFVGSYVLRRLVEEGHAVRCLMRRPDDPLAVEDGAVERVQGDVTDPASLVGTLEGCDAVIHLVGIVDEVPSKGVTFDRIHRQGTRHLVDAARQAGLDRFIHMSANGARPNGVSSYQTTKWEAEKYVREAGFQHWTIFRPSIVFGDPGPHNVSFEVRLARTLVGPFPILPVFGSGRYEMQPIAVENVASAFVQALTAESARRQAYCAAGRKRYEYNEVLDVITRALGRSPKPKVHVPAWLARPMVQLGGSLGLLPISADQFEMLLDGNTCEASVFHRDFELEPASFAPDQLGYLQERA